MKRNIDLRKVSSILTDRRRSAAGFTLSETVIVIAIILVLMTLAVPGILSLRRDLTITRLDETAKEIYAAAQNSLTRLDNSALSAALSGTEMPEAPADYSGASWSAVSDSFFYADQDSDAAKELLPLGSIEGAVRSGGRYIIEYNLKTASIYSVFYADSDFDYTALFSDAGFRGSRDNRKAVLVGYYGGSAVDRDDFERCVTPSISVENGDVLRLTISGYKPGLYGSMRIVLADSEKHSMELSYPSAPQPSNLVLNPDNSFTLTLDSLEGERFAALCPGLTPGSDIGVTVYFEKSGALSSYSSATVNSLFASRDGGTAYVGYARHLQNLDASYSFVAADITAAEQTANITWTASKSFESIGNDALKAYDGNKQRITALSSPTGLFEALSGAALSDIYLVNSRVQSFSASPAGSLAGELTGCTVSGCQVYSYLVANGGVNYEGYSAFGLSSSGVSGGLIGSATGCAVSDSFAALPYLNGSDGSGGLIGTAKNTSVTNCYSACDSFRGGAMLIADADAASVVNNCYAVGNSAAATEALPLVSGGSVTNSYCAFSYLDGATKNFATDYLVYDGGGAVTRSDKDKLSAAVPGTWGGSAAAVTRPYSRALDGRAYPYRAVPGLRHCGSWPLEGGLLLTVQLKLESGAAAPSAGDVTIQRADTGETLYNSDNLNMANPVEVPVGVKLAVTVSTNSGYSYRYSQLTGKPTVTGTRFEFTPESDTTLTVVFRQTAFTLTAADVENENGAKASSYRVTAGSVSMLPVGERKVYTDTKVVVTPETGSEYFVKGVRYVTADGNEFEVKRDSDGNFSFAMPGSNTTIYVTYTKKYVLCNIYYHRMDADGGYDENVSVSDSIHLGIGETINSALIDYFAGRSNIPVTINGVKCIALDSQKTTLWKLQNNKTEQLTIPYTTTAADETTTNQNKSLSIHLYFARSQHKVTLVSGDNISSVRLGSGTPDPVKTENTLYFGKNITAVATVSGNVEFTEWREVNDAFTGSGNPSYNFTVPSYDIILKASAVRGYRQITLDLYKNGDSWPLHGQTLYLENRDTGKLFLMDNLTDPTTSFRSQKSVPAGVYYVRVGAANGERYTAGLAAPIELDCTNRAVNGRLDFYTVSFNPNATRYSGSVPSGGVYPKGHSYTVPGNAGALRRNDSTSATMFAGWYDAYIDALDPTAYDEGAEVTITGRIAFFAKWQSGLAISYDANGADGGELPYDSTAYSYGDTVALKFPSAYTLELYRTGYSFVGWRDSSDSGSGHLYTESGTPTLTFGGVNIVLYAQWQKNNYNVSCYSESGSALTGSAYNKVVEHGGSYTLPSYTPPSGAGSFVGWATENNGAVRYAPGLTITVNAETRFYAIVADETVRVSYHYKNNSPYTVTVGKNIPFYLSYLPSGVSSLIGWSTTANYTGEIYRCDENGVSLAPVSFDSDTDLYALSGRVYNSTRNLWYDTLYAAVNGAASNNSLVVYADTSEPGVITISKNLFITADGVRTVSWKNSSNFTSFYGCLTISSTVCLGSDAIDSSEMGAGNSLTLDAAQEGHVVMLNSGASLYMYDGVTLTNGLVSSGSNLNSNGGGVLAKNGSSFYMRGGTVSYCSAEYGGGVYLVGGSHMEMGRMMHPGTIGQGYMEGGVYYKQVSDSVYEIDGGVDASNYSSSFVPYGTPSISFNSATHDPWYASADMYAQSNGGGGLFLDNLGQNGILLYSGEISFNSATCNGGGILTDSSGDKVLLRIYEVEISHNVANNGGGVYQWQGTVFIYNSIISQNYARANGGGIALTIEKGEGEKSAIEFYYGDVTGNQAGHQGGAMYIKGKTTLQMFGGSLIDNHAPQGGAVYVDYNSNPNNTRSSGLFELSGGYISGNDDGGSGDIYLANNTYIHVPTALNLERPSYAPDDDRIIVACGNAANGRTVVGYDDPAALLETDANSFFYVDRAAYTVFPGSGELVLGAENGKRSVSFDENRSGAPAPQSLEYAIGTDILSAAVPVSPAPPAPNVPGRKFVGWALRKDAALSEALSSYTVTDLFGQTLYALWDDYHITYDVSGAPSTVIVPPVAKGPTVTLPELKSSDGKPIVGYNDTNTLSYTYAFVGWSKTAGSATAEYHAGDVIGTTQSPMTEDLTLYAVWTKTQTTSHNVTFKPNGGDGSELTLPVSEGLSLKAKPASYFTRDGHDFVEWNTADNGSGTAFAPDADITMGTADIVLYARWQIRSYTVSYDLAGGVSAEPIAQQTYDHGAALSLPAADPYRDHYTFTGWFDMGGAQYSDGYQVKADLTLYAGWQIDTFTVSYDKNGGSGSISPSTVEWDGSLVLPTAGAGIVRAGYELSSWNTKADKSGTSYAPGDTLANVSASITLYAQWTKLHTVRFYSNYGTNAELSPAQTVSDGDSLTLPDATDREGYSFNGWSIDGTAAAGDAAGTAVYPAKDTDYYAIWVAEPAP